MLTYLIYNTDKIQGILFMLMIITCFISIFSMFELENERLALFFIVICAVSFIAFLLMPNAEYLCYLTQQDIPRCMAK